MEPRAVRAVAGRRRRVLLLAGAVLVGASLGTWGEPGAGFTLAGTGRWDVDPVARSARIRRLAGEGEGEGAGSSSSSSTLLQEPAAVDGDANKGGEGQSEKIPVSALQVGQEFTGKVKSKAKGGLRVDIGAECSGFLPKDEQLKGANKTRYGQGDTVAVRVLQTVFNNTRWSFKLTMLPGSLERQPQPSTVGKQEPAAADAGKGGEGKSNKKLPIADLQPFFLQDVLDGQIEEVNELGAFVKVVPAPGAEPALGVLSRKQWLPGFESEAKPGVQVKVRVVNVNSRKKHVFFTMTP